MGPTIVELAVWLLTVDDVEAVGGPHAHPAHLKVEPLVMVIAVNIWIQDKIILEPVEEKMHKKQKWRLNINYQQNWCGTFWFDHQVRSWSNFMQQQLPTS